MDAVARAPSPSPPSPLDFAALEAIARHAWLLELPQPHERSGVLRDEAALLIDGLLTRVARSRGALDVAIGEKLDALSVGDRVLKLGYSGLGDYAREKLGIAGRTAQSMARLARELRDRPALAAAVRRGEVSVRKAQAVLAVARGDAEAGWVARARVETVRALEAAVRARSLPGGGEAAADEPWERVVSQLTPEGRAALDEAMDLAGKILGPTSPRWERLEAICAEYLGTYPDDAAGDAAWNGVHRADVDAWLPAAMAGLEAESRRWEFLANPPPVAAPAGVEGADGPDGPWLLDEHLRRLAAMRDRWDELVGHLALLVVNLGLWRDMQFASFAHYVTERLGMSARAVEQRVALERRLYSLPALRTAMRERRVSYEQARLVAAHADDRNVLALIGRAEETTAIALRRELEAARETQMRARAELDLRVPKTVGALLDAAIRSARRQAGRWIPSGEAIARVARHFADTWREAAKERNTPQNRVKARDEGFCQVPGCSRAGGHSHHIIPRAAGGTDDAWNQVGTCPPHHLHAIHRGYVRVRGRAPDHLVWELGVRPDS